MSDSKTNSERPDLPVASLLPLTGGYTVTNINGNYNRKSFMKVFAYVSEHYMRNFGCTRDDHPTGTTHFSFHKIGIKGWVLPMAEKFGDTQAGVFFSKAQVKDIFSQHPTLFKKDTTYYFPYTGGFCQDVKSFAIVVYPQCEKRWKKFFRKYFFKWGWCKFEASWAFDMSFGEVHVGSYNKQVLVLPCMPEQFLN